MKRKTLLLPILASICCVTTAFAAETSLSAKASTEDGVDASSSSNEDPAPAAAAAAPADSEFEQQPFEIGLFGGLMFLSSKHSLHEADMPLVHFKKVSPELGLRLGFYPVDFFGIEGELGGIFTKTVDDGSAKLLALRAQGVLQYPNKYIIPFVAFGGGRLGVDSDTMGQDADGELHFGVGVKLPVSNNFLVRLDGRDNITNYAKGESRPQHFEALLGVSFAFGGSEKKPAEPDTDGDGLLDSKDACPTVAAATPDGCPIPDTDGDGVLDPNDACPKEAGTLPNGCPELDADKDGILLPADKCPTEIGIAPDGCPDQDPDKDGIRGSADKCPTEPETKNGFEDADGCPDTMPEKVKEFTGVIAGIEFDTGKASIRGTSFGVLDRAIAVLLEFPSLNVEITGHTDSVGTAEKNRVLSADRANSVKQYMAEKGVDASRIQTRGAGPDEPIADNKTAAGKQKNRRIEFKVLQ